MGLLPYARLLLTGLLGGTAAGLSGGLSLGWLLALGYRRQGPFDLGDPRHT